MSRRATTVTGARAETFVADQLEGEGYEILARNARVGRYELDIVARRGAMLVVVEVRSRTDSRLGSPVESIDRKKVQRVRQAAAGWIAHNRPGTNELRFDAAAVTFDGPDGAPQLTYYEDAF